MYLKRDSGYEESVQEMLREKNSKIETLMQELEVYYLLKIFFIKYSPQSSLNILIRRVQNLYD